MQCRSRDTEAHSHECGMASWGPRGMAQCVWLLTFEHPSDLPPVYMRFGLRKTGFACDAMTIGGLQTFLNMKGASV